MQQPQIVLNWGAVGISILAAFFFGFAWYGPIFGKKWAGLMGQNCDQKPDPAVMRKALTLQIIGLFLMTYVLAHVGQVWRPSVWGYGPDVGSDTMFGFFCGFFTWVGFFIPQQLSKVAWEQRPWRLFLINAGHDFINLQLISQILAHWR